jgi:DNA-binding transcriptional regulator YiaG
VPGPTTPSPAEIKADRQRLGLTQAAFADALGISLRAVEEWEAGRRRAQPYLRLALERLLEAHGRR